MKLMTLFMIFTSCKIKIWKEKEKITEIKSGEILYKGNDNVIKAITDKMKLELKPHSYIDFNSPATSAEECFLSKLNPITLTEEEKSELLSPTNEAEISYILEQIRNVNNFNGV